ncbi:Uncharacterized protein TCM_039464 [Theobroma cacao]|uniref:Uncharacterized protein n=1 Tax=Theobroma cacao TaxID=3641 RepID=A0A061GY52_THECC|nr:Uncharacterized protein TCM_039464 [Theobroma cacao]
MNSRGVNFSVWVHSFLLPSMIESASPGGDKDSLSVEVYSPYTVVHQFSPGGDKDSLSVEVYSPYTVAIPNTKAILDVEVVLGAETVTKDVEATFEVNVIPNADPNPCASFSLILKHRDVNSALALIWHILSRAV